MTIYPKIDRRYVNMTAKELREEIGCGIMEGREMIDLSRVYVAVDNAETLEELKTAMLRYIQIKEGL